MRLSYKWQLLPAFNRPDESSNLLQPTKFMSLRSSVWTEQLAFNLLVVGSNPTGGTKFRICASAVRRSEIYADMVVNEMPHVEDRRTTGEWMRIYSPTSYLI